MAGSSLERARAQVAESLRARRAEIEQATLTRVRAITDPVTQADPEYAHGLRVAVSAAIEHGLTALERSQDRPPPVPPVLLAQARLAARAGVSLDTVLRRYFAGYTLFGDFVIAEAEQGALLRGSAFQRLLRGQAVLFDRVVAAVSEEYSREEPAQLVNSEQYRADQIQRLLAGELLDTAKLAYDFEAWHLGAIAFGPGSAEALSELAECFGHRLLLVRREESMAWAWFGARQKPDPGDFARIASRVWPAEASLSLGEPSRGLAGWRLSHRQAKAALPAALRGRGGVVRYADVALVASMLRDDLLITSLHELYLAPLGEERDGGAVARETLRAYFTAERNVSSAAAALGVNRQTVANRLRSIEERLGRPLTTCTADLEAALRLEDLGMPVTSAGDPPNGLPDSRKTPVKVSNF